MRPQPNKLISEGHTAKLSTASLQSQTTKTTIFISIDTATKKLVNSMKQSVGKITAVTKK